MGNFKLRFAPVLEKQCFNCKEVKHASMFSRGRTVSGLSSVCKACDRLKGIKRREYNKEQLKVEKAEWYQENKERITSELRQASKDDPLKHRRYELRRRFNMTMAEFDDLLLKQGGVCAACGETEPGGPYNKWQIDHDHACCDGRKTCGRCIRGLLCSVCNLTLGNAKDSVDRLQGLVWYLTKYKKVA